MEIAEAVEALVQQFLSPTVALYGSLGGTEVLGNVP